MSEYQYHEGEIRASMPAEHAEAILRGDNRMPRKGDVCDMSCQFAFACANHVRDEPCQGFQLLGDGKLERHVRHNLDAYDRKSIENYVDMIQRSHSPEVLSHLVPVVYRSLKPPTKKKEKLRTMRGFTEYEINENGTLSLIPEPQHEKSKVPDPEPECLIMLRLNEQKRKEKENEPT